MNDNKKLINELVIASLEGTITEEQFVLLKQLLRDDDEAAQYYVEISSVISQLRRSEFKPEIFDDNELEKSYENISFDLDLWRSLAENEKQAPKVPSEKRREAPELIEKVVYKKSPRRISKFSLYSLIVSVAALLLLIIYVKFNPDVTARNVATLVDSVNAQWANISIPIRNGSRLSTTQGSILLSKGAAKLLFDNNTKVVLEAPAEFELLKNDRIALHYGRLYATVPHEALGFTVTTRNSKIIDLGTEFGVEVGFDSTTELHVMQGKTTLVSGEKGKTSLLVMEGKAKRISGLTATISDIACNWNQFVREIDSQSSLLWRGQKQINLADIVGGGDGFGSGQTDFGIDPVKGKFSVPVAKGQKAANKYVRVSGSTFIDGVFVPDGHSKQIISSAGHLFTECPLTSGSFHSFITNCLGQKDGLPLSLNNVNYSDPQNPSIFLHSNLGITFDLNAFRSRLPEAKINQFQADIGVSDTTPGLFDADVWVLIDGQVRYKKTGITQKGLLDSLRIDIRDQDCFLTLITTEGKNTRDNTSYPRSSNAYDWVLFARPVLTLE